MNDSFLSPAVMLAIYCALVFLASLAGGGLPSLIHLTHTRLQTAIIFIAGLMLGMALLHLIPHAIGETHSVDRAMGWALGGFLVMFFLQRAFHYHQHGVPNDAASGPGPGAGRGHNHAAASAPDDLPGATRKLSWAARWASARGDSFASRAATCCPNCTSTRTTDYGSPWLCWQDWGCPFSSEPSRAMAAVTVVTKQQTNNIKIQTKQT